MRSLARLLTVATLAGGLLLPAQQAFAFSDVPSSYWAATQINYVAPWMSDYGSSTFKPTTLETRSFAARTLVKMFAASESVDPSIHFSDLADSDAMYRYANVAVKLHWMSKCSDNRWCGGNTFQRRVFDRALLLALKLDAPIAGLRAIHEADGDAYSVGTYFPHQALAAYLRLHYNHTDESMDVQATQPMRRDEVAYSLWRVKTMPSYTLSGTSRFNDITLPAVAADSVQRRLTLHALRQIRFPYIWAGEWSRESPSGYCCGYQPQGGFDCSGFVWWVLKKNESGYNAAQYRDYAGWSLPQRSSSTMAQYTSSKISFANLQIGDLMFFASNGGSTYTSVDHVGIYAGNNWMIHSTSGGPQIEWVGDGWYRDKFVYGRRLMGSSSSAPARSGGGFDPAAGDADVGPER